MKKKNKILILIIILFIALVIAIIVLKSQKKTTNTNTNTNVQTISYYEDSNIDKLDNMSERSRIKFYFSQYIENLENEAYDKAYDMLYSEFKKKYFPTLEDFEDYVQKKYPKIFTLNYDYIKTEGFYYILTITFFDSMKDTEFTQKFIIREYNYNDIDISFQAE